MEDTNLRYVFDIEAGGWVPSGPPPTKIALAHLPAHNVQPLALGPMARNDTQGRPYQARKLILPPVQIAAQMIAQYQGRPPIGVASARAFPYKLKAVGPVNFYDIMYGRGSGFVSDTVEVVP